MTYPKPGELPLNNQQAKEIAEKILGELWREFHPTGTMKIVSNLSRAFAREQKNVIVQNQINRAHAPL